MSDTNNIQAYLTNNKSLHDYIEELTVSDACNRLIVTTYSISEDSLRVIDELVKNGHIKHLTFIFNNSIIKNKYSLFLYAQSIANEIYLTDIHAKIVLFEDKVLITSSNFNKIKRYETFLIIDQVDTLEYFRKQISQLILDAEKVEL